MILELLIKRTKINTMNIVKTEIEGVLIIEPRLFRDSCCYFFEISASESLKRRLPQFRTTDVHLYHDDNIGKSVMFVEFNKESV